MNNYLKYFLLGLTMAVVTSCGGGGSSSSTNTPPPPATSHTATVKLATSGTPSAQLAGVGVTLVLPSGVTPALNTDGSVATSVSGVAAPGSMLAPIYTPATDTAKGTIRFVLASKITAGFGAGEFATITLVVAPGYNPSVSDFATSGLATIDVRGNSATGLTATVTGLSVQ